MNEDQRRLVSAGTLRFDTNARRAFVIVLAPPTGMRIRIADRGCSRALNGRSAPDTRRLYAEWSSHYICALRIVRTRRLTHPKDTDRGGRGSAVHRRVALDRNARVRLAGLSHGARPQLIRAELVALCLRDAADVRIRLGASHQAHKNDKQYEYAHKPLSTGPSPGCVKSTPAARGRDSRRSCDAGSRTRSRRRARRS